MKSQIKAYRKAHLFCEVCGMPDTQIHHIRTRGAGGSDDATNLLALCYYHHTKIHAIGSRKFAYIHGLQEKFSTALNKRRS